MSYVDADLAVLELSAHPQKNPIWVSIMPVTSGSKSGHGMATLVNAFS
jgi:hypothetical protein